MILAFAKIWCCRNADIVNDYFRCSKDAEDSRQGEYDAAVMIQKTWRRFVCQKSFLVLRTLALRIQRVFRGYRGRLRAATIAVELNRQRRMKFYNHTATKIQKIWRGWLSRMRLFDFTHESDEQHAPKLLALRESEQRETFAALEIISNEKKLLQIASTRHHLLGTKAIPGVFAG
ncbi:hypothetical protein BASA81_013617 [Batrachochytrium salamandrivorans]|nr:hypothetical protein BASA81_013617 [Batrachochytrium salamandrivorans]